MFGNATKYNPKVRNFWNQDESVSLAKSFRISEDVRIDLRGEAFNILNRTIFGAGSTNLNSNTFGSRHQPVEQPASDAGCAEVLLVVCIRVITIQQTIDRRVSAILADRGDWPCRKGCDDCCRHLAAIPSITQPEWELLRAGFELLSEQEQSLVRSRVEALRGPTDPSYALS